MRSSSSTPDPAEVAANAPEGLRWLERFQQENGRPLRVLHIGNVANNAYNNARIQRQRGIDADVICPDYFHIMASPEWEDADYDGDVGDPRFPDWWAADLKGFVRPRWFAQGEVETCQRYLLAVRRRRKVAAAALWRRLELERWLLSRRSRPAEVARATRTRVGSIPWRRIGWRTRLRLARRARLVRDAVQALRARDIAAARSRLAGLFRHAEQVEVAESEPSVLRRWRELFPEREPLSPDDYASHAPRVSRWRVLLGEYDVVQAYGPAPIIPMRCDAPFAAYEHGTLRVTPFEDSATGRICALGYREAATVFVTNSDVLPSARRLGIPDEKLVRLPHAVDSDRLLRFGAAHHALAPRADAEVVFLAPTRQDWVDGDPSWAKGSDRMVRALALVCDRGLRCRLLLVAWGRHLAETRALIDELDVGEFVGWIPPLQKRALWNAYLSSHAVLDQFVLPAIGGVAFEAMALGRRVITALDRETAAAFFGAEPPLLAASSADEIARAMIAVIEDPLDEAGLGEAARAWFARYHSADRIVDLQARAYRRMLAGAG